MSLEKTKYDGSTDEKKVTRSVSSERSKSKQPDVVGYVKGVQNLNVRERPSPNADVLTTIPMGSAVTVKGSTDDYYRITTPDLTEGFVMKGFLEVRR